MAGLFDYNNPSAECFRDETPILCDLADFGMGCVDQLHGAEGLSREVTDRRRRAAGSGAVPFS